MDLRFISWIAFGAIVFALVPYAAFAFSSLDVWWGAGNTRFEPLGRIVVFASGLLGAFIFADNY